MYEEVVKERDEVIQKNLQLYVDLQEANKRLSSSSVAPAVLTPLSPSLLPPTSLCPMSSLPKAGTPSFAVADVAMGSTPRASSIVGGKSLPQAPPVAAPFITLEDVMPQQANTDAIPKQAATVDEVTQLKERLAAAEAQSNRRYEEMREYKIKLKRAKHLQLGNLFLFPTIHLDFGISMMVRMLSVELEIKYLTLGIG
eukprot:s1011_g10.t1